MFYNYYSNRFKDVEVMSNILGKITIFLSFIIFPMNLLGGIVGGIWLLFMKEWEIVFLGFIISIIFPYAYSIITLFQFPIMALLNYLQRKNKIILRNIVAFINIFLQNLVNLAWVFIVFLSLVELGKGKNAIPYFIYGWFIALGPFQFMASKEPPDSYGTYLGMFLIIVTYIILVITYFLKLVIFALPLILLFKIFLEVLNIKLLKVYDY